MGHAETSRPVWHGSWTIEQLHALTRGTLVEHHHGPAAQELSVSAGSTRAPIE